MSGVQVCSHLISFLRISRICLVSSSCCWLATQKTITSEKSGRTLALDKSD